MLIFSLMKPCVDEKVTQEEEDEFRKEIDKAIADPKYPVIVRDLHVDILCASATPTDAGVPANV